ncbi:TIM barrel protein (plasmid) [Caballeronia sp. NK8]|uniref:sugar phosphate isomerase/epimerase family protein n=1 Tax=Caballeronia sp. NK8 TaxID=140098 RepID=UPI001BB7CBAD|nr:TIM barrel protein [Caballeronia sp. NK8]BCQ29446.1 TIM barrel protein [Caballeronia sp. NK8]
MHELSLHHLTILDAHPLQLVDAAAAAGFEYCGLRLIAPTATDAIVDVANNPALIRELHARLDATGVRLLDIEAIWLSPQTDVASLLPALEAGRTLGARHVLCVGNDTERARLRDNFGRLCEAADGFGLSVGLEAITYCTISTPADALDLVRSSGQPNARILIDALQFFRSGATCEQIDAIDPALIEYIQICDAPSAAPQSLEARRKEARTARLLPGDGELPLRELLSKLRSDLPLAVEAPTLALRGLPFDEQARHIHARMRTFLAGPVS